MHWVLTRAVNFPHVQKAFRCRFSSFLLRANTRSFFLLLLSLTFLSFFATTCRIGQNGNKRDKERERVRVLYACAFLDRISRGFRGIESSCLPCVGKHLQGQICPRQFWVSQWPPSLSLHVKSGLLTIGFLFSKNQRPVLVSLGIVYPVGSVPALVQADTSQPAPTRQKAIHHSKVRIWMTDSEEREREEERKEKIKE